MTEQDIWDQAILGVATLDEVSELVPKLPWQKYYKLESRIRSLTTGSNARRINESDQDQWEQIEESIFTMRAIKILEDPDAPEEDVNEARILVASVKAANLRKATTPPKRGENAVVVGLDGRPKKFFSID